MLGNRSMFASLMTSEARDIAIVRNIVLRSLQEYTLQIGFNQLFPTTVLPSAESLARATEPPHRTTGGCWLELSARRIASKQLVLSGDALERIFLIAPSFGRNPADDCRGDHQPRECSQFDLELRNASMFKVMSLVNALFNHVFESVRTNHQSTGALERLGRILPPMAAAFPVMSSQTLADEYGDHFEAEISRGSDTPVFIINNPPDFYDREDLGNPGTYRNFNMVYPDCFGVGLSGGERELDHARLVAKMVEAGIEPGLFRKYLERARIGKIPQTSGAVFAIEHLLRFIIGRDQVSGEVSSID